MSDNSIVKSSISNNGLDIMDNPELFLNKINNLDKIATIIAESETYGKLFKVAKKNADGSVAKNENGEIIEEVSKSDIICCIGLGKEMGLDVFGSLAFGKALNADSYKKVVRGRALGLDPIASLNMISIIPTRNGDIIHTGVHVITNALNKGGIRYDIVEDFVPIKLYPVLSDKFTNTGIFIDEQEYEDNSSKYLLLTNSSKPDELNAAVENNIIVIKPAIISRRTTAIFKRNNYSDLKISYTLQEAIDAELYKGITSSGTKTNGKDNWNNNPATMLRNRTLTIGGRIIGSDIIHNTYSSEEVISISPTYSDKISDNDNIEDVTYTDK